MRHLVHKTSFVRTEVLCTVHAVLGVPKPITKSTPSWNKFEYLLVGNKSTYSCNYVDSSLL